jgi:hypothetical protein
MIGSNILRSGKAILLMLLLSVSASSIQQDRTKRVQFERGRTSTVIKDSVVRGTKDNYILGARKGQTLTVHISSSEDNAVFDVYRYVEDGKRLTDEDETTDWEGELPESGDYLISVSGTRGNASYTLEITIR